MNKTTFLEELQSDINVQQWKVGDANKRGRSKGK